MNGFQVYHLNLAFSSIPTAARGDVIRRCYWPLLQLAEELRIPVGIELTGWTLSQIQQIDPAWVARFRAMLAAGQCELIGSGWSQMIGPLVPPEMNFWNQKLGCEAYQTLLGQRPRLALVNEMAFSTSLISHYKEAGYEGIIMDRDNVRLALDLDHHPAEVVPTHALGPDGESFPVLWSDSILFQRLQRVVHGDIPVSEYLDYVRQRSTDGTPVLPVYCNDAEIFDYRPGRFTTEARLHPEGEWARMRRVFTALSEEAGLSWVTPSQALSAQTAGQVTHAAILSSAAHPIPVKKQAKYNINRWAVTGRDDLWLNTTCHRLHQRLLDSSSQDPEAWRSLCEFWASDLRTHITQERWEDMLARLRAFEAALPGKRDEPQGPAQALPSRSMPSFEPANEDIYWTCETADVRLVLNARRGLTLKTLAFRSQDFVPLLGTLPQGYFESIDLGADYYSGGVLIEIPGERTRLTDLEWVKPEVSQTSTEFIIQGTLPLATGRLVKTISVSLTGEQIRLTYAFEGWQRPLGIVRVGALTLLPEAWSMPLTLHCKNGGHAVEQFPIQQPFSHIQPASLFVSSTAAIGATDGHLAVTDTTGKGISVTWDPAACAAIPMMKHLKTRSSHLTRIFFSLAELDDTSKPGGHLVPLTLTLRPASKR